MAIFYKPQTRPVSRPIAASGSGKKGPPEAEYPEPAEVVPSGGGPPPSKFSWVRLACAIALLVALFVAGIYTAKDSSPEVKRYAEVLLHAFEILLGGVIGIVVGEAGARRG